MTNAGGDRNTGRDGGAGATDGCVLYHFLILSALLLILLLSDCLFSTEHANRRGGMGRKRRGRDYVSFAPSSGCRGGATGVYSVIFVCYSPLLFFSLFLFFVVSFFAKISTGGLGRGRAGPTRAAIETRDETERGGQRVRFM